MAVTDYNGKEKASLNNMKALWQFLTGGGAQQLRKAMGLGDTLGPLQPECGGSGKTMHGTYDCVCTYNSAYVDIAMPDGIMVDDVEYLCLIGFYTRYGSGGDNFLFTGEEMPLKSLLDGTYFPVGFSDAYLSTSRSNKAVAYGNVAGFKKLNDTTIRFSHNHSWFFDKANINKKTLEGAAAWVVL